MRTASELEWALEEGPRDFWQENEFRVEPASQTTTLRCLREAELNDVWKCVQRSCWLFGNYGERGLQRRWIGSTQMLMLIVKHTV
jgi:hypothetical protein